MSCVPVDKRLVDADVLQLDASDFNPCGEDVVHVREVPSAAD